ncbi:hypothetical protein FRB90_010514, partial [Tulasnella sp. 427]
MARRTSTTIHSLPEELLLEAIRVVISPERPLGDLVHLSSVCRRWKTILFGASSLWSSISGLEGLHVIRQAIRLSKNAPLDITYNSTLVKRTSGTSLAAFLHELSTTIHRWRSLEIFSKDLYAMLEALNTTPAPNLTTLRLNGRSHSFDPEQPDLLFGGYTGLPSLKHFSATMMTIAPQQVSGLKSLSLTQLVLTSADLVCEILLDSPELEVLHIDLPDARGSPKVAGELPRSPFIELPLLREITMVEVPTAFGRFFWSAVNVPGLLKLSVGGP